MVGNDSTAEAVLVIGLYKDPMTGKIMTPLTRSDAWQTSMWRIPGGGVEESETRLQAAIRENKEEVGLHVEELHTFKSIDKRSRNQLHTKHTQHILVGTVHSIAEFRTTTQDGGEILINEMFDIDRIRNAIKFNGLLSHYEILRFHSLILEELFNRLFGKF